MVLMVIDIDDNDAKVLVSVEGTCEFVAKRSRLKYVQIIKGDYCNFCRPKFWLVEALPSMLHVENPFKFV